MVFRFRIDLISISWLSVLSVRILIDDGRDLCM
jgi:hypothetical protein